MFWYVCTIFKENKMPIFLKTKRYCEAINISFAVALETQLHSGTHENQCRINYQILSVNTQVLDNYHA